MVEDEIERAEESQLLHSMAHSAASHPAGFGPAGAGVSAGVSAGGLPAVPPAFPPTLPRQSSGGRRQRPFAPIPEAPAPADDALSAGLSAGQSAGNGDGQGRSQGQGAGVGDSDESLGSGSESGFGGAYPYSGAPYSGGGLDLSGNFSGDLSSTVLHALRGSSLGRSGLGRSVLGRSGMAPPRSVDSILQSGAVTPPPFRPLSPNTGARC